MNSDAVLVIDDDPDFRDLVRLHVEAEGVLVFEAGDCLEGVEVLRREGDRIALVLLDYWMPNLEPRCCCDKVLGLVRPTAKVVLVTAAVDPSRRAEELGLAQWLSKPFDFELLSRLVREARSAAGRPQTTPES